VVTAFSNSKIYRDNKYMELPDDLDMLGDRPEKIVLKRPKFRNWFIYGKNLKINFE
jgi:hypothetical protein